MSTATLPAAPPARVIPREQLQDALLFMAMRRLGHSVEAADQLVAKLQAARIELNGAAPSDRMADRLESHAAGVMVARERAVALAAEQTAVRVAETGSAKADMTKTYWKGE